MRANDGFSSLAHGLISILHKYALLFRFSFLFVSTLSFFSSFFSFFFLFFFGGGSRIQYVTMCDTIYAVYPQNEIIYIYFCKLYATALLFVSSCQSLIVHDPVQLTGH